MCLDTIFSVSNKRALEQPIPNQEGMEKKIKGNTGTVAVRGQSVINFRFAAISFPSPK